MAKGIFKLLESEIEKAQIVMAVNAEISSKLQRDAEKIANMKVDVLGPIIDRIKAEHGLKPAEAFRDTVTGILDQALNAVMQAKEQIYTETLKLTGDVGSQSEAVDDLDAEGGTFGDFDMGGEFSPEEDLGADLPAEPIPADREVKESVRKYGLVMESKTGKVGTKYFQSKSEMRQWVSENNHKIKSIKDFKKL